MSGVSTTTTARQPLDEVMLAMDVVDTLRHRSQLVDQELDSDQRDKKMMERLRKIYTAQGIEVSDRILKEGVEALKEERFVYAPPEPGLGTSLATLYVSRGSWGKWVIGALAALGAAFAIYYFAVLAPRAELPGQLTAMRDQTLQIAQDDDAKSSARSIYQQAQAALNRGDRDAAQSSLAALAGLRETLEQSYNVRIVNRPGEQSGVYRIPNLNESARNYYIVVEAIDKTGNKLAVNITSEETGKTSKVSEWGVRVDQAIYNQVGADKQDDGIIQNNRFGTKQRGHLTPEYAFPTTGAAITDW
jgi:hypothetical protein